MAHLKPELIAFDLNGALVDSSPDIAIAINQMLTELNQDTYPEQALMVGDSINDIQADYQIDNIQHLAELLC